MTEEQRDELQLARNFLRQVREYLQANNPVMAHALLMDANRYLDKVMEQEK